MSQAKGSTKHCWEWDYTKMSTPGGHTGIKQVIVERIFQGYIIRKYNYRNTEGVIKID